MPLICVVSTEGMKLGWKRVLSVPARSYTGDDHHPGFCKNLVQVSTHCA